MGFVEMGFAEMGVVEMRPPDTGPAHLLEWASLSWLAQYLCTTLEPRQLADRFLGRVGTLLCNKCGNFKM